ncbi:MAG: hypothetical protein CMM45_09215 [Rhodospirillaceae bacterium]|nr:hypothetical protein [Rhodospirillaceae bacterium]
MPKIFNKDTIDPETLSDGALRRVLLDDSITSNDNIRLDHWDLGSGCTMPLSVAGGDITWLQVLDGTVQLSGSEGTHTLGNQHLMFLPGGFEGRLEGHERSRILHARVPDAARFDPAFANTPPGFRLVDWSKEPVLDSTHDARKRIYFVTPQLFSTKAISGEMIIYPPNTVASNHYHEDAEHFQYVISGEGIVYTDEQPHRLRPGDIVYNYEREHHYFECDGSENFVFVEFFVPGEFKTIWVENAPICTWEPTGKNIRGGAPSREIGAHSSQPVETPADV